MAMGLWFMIVGIIVASFVYGEVAFGWVCIIVISVFGFIGWLDKLNEERLKLIYSKCPKCHDRSPNRVFRCGRCKMDSEAFIANDVSHWNKLMEDHRSENPDIKDGRPIERD